jgi:hypothetical protein
MASTFLGKDASEDRRRFDRDYPSDAGNPARVLIAAFIATVSVGSLSKLASDKVFNI